MEPNCCYYCDKGASVLSFTCTSKLRLPPDWADVVYMCMEGKEVCRGSEGEVFGAELLLLL